jgi:L-iditol 2-dehydrogenase
MKALVLTAYGRLELLDVPTPPRGPDDVLVRVHACGICGSDVHGMDGSTGRRRPPLIMGHEAAGIIEEASSDLRGFTTGDRVTFDSTISCGTCWFCRRGATNLCDDRRVLGVSCDEYRREGAFAEFVAVPSRVLCRLPDGVSFEQGSMVEPLSVALHAVRRLRPGPAESVVVVGAGMIGLLVIQILRRVSCGIIIAVDIDPGRLAIARRFGATAALDPGTVDVRAEVAACTNGRGTDSAYEVVGTTEALATAIACVRKGGSVALVGNLSPRVDLALQAAVLRELTIFGSCASSGDYPDCMQLMAEGGVDVMALVSAVEPLATGSQWFDRLRDRESGLMKVILKP